jgi:nicotinamidase-related amidase
MSPRNKTALIVVDPMERIVALDTAPYASSAVVHRAVQLASAFRECGELVVFVRTERFDVARQPPGGHFVESIKPQASDVVITKQSWNAFHDTELDATLRDRAIDTLVLAGIATNFGVEGTARAGAERGYQLIFVEDAITALDAHAHSFAIEYVFPRLGRVCSVQEILTELAG